MLSWGRPTFKKKKIFFWNIGRAMRPFSTIPFFDRFIPTFRWGERLKHYRERSKDNLVLIQQRKIMFNNIFHFLLPPFTYSRLSRSSTAWGNWDVGPLSVWHNLWGHFEKTFHFKSTSFQIMLLCNPHPLLGPQNAHKKAFDAHWQREPSHKGPAHALNTQSFIT